MKDEWEILLYYKYSNIENPQELVLQQRSICQRLSLKGRIIIAKEGINGTLEGTKINTQKYIDDLTSKEEYRDIHFKRSPGNGTAFPKLKVKLREEIVSAHLGNDDVNPAEITGKYLNPEELRGWIESGKNFYIVDMRNDYEYEVGHFKNSILPKLKNFRDLPKILPEIENIKSETILTVCTGGVRCEKASGYLVSKGFKNTYQLNGGIVSYMEKYPNQDFLGKLYVFDNRVVMGFNIDDPEHQVISKCSKCHLSSDNYIDCRYKHCKGHRHFLACITCLKDDVNNYCSEECYQLDNPKTILPKSTNNVKMSDI